MTNIIQDHVLSGKIIMPEVKEIELSYGPQSITKLSFKDRVRVKAIAESEVRKAQAEGMDQFGQDATHDAFLILAAAQYGATITDGVSNEKAHSMCDNESYQSLFDYVMSEKDIQDLGIEVVFHSGMESLLKLEQDEESEDDDSDIPSPY